MTTAAKPEVPATPPAPVVPDPAAPPVTPPVDPAAPVVPPVVPPVDPAAPVVPPVEPPKTDEPKSVVPDTYDLKLPDGSKLDPAIVERTAARARALGLSNEAGQQLLDQTVQDLTEQQTAAKAAETALVEAWKPGGAEFVKRDTAWRGQALADPDIANGSQERLATTIEKAQLALNKYGPELKTYLDETGLGSHPAAIKFLANIGRAMSEGSFVPGATSSPGKPKNDAQLLYPADYNEDGSPKIRT